MKQRTRVVSIIRNQEGILVLKPHRGRTEAPVLWELPTGKIKFGEQPEEAAARSLSEFTGLTAASVALKDAITFLATEGMSSLSNLYLIYELGVAKDVKPTPAGRYTAYKYLKDFTSAALPLSPATTSVLEIIESKISLAHISPRSTANSVTVHVDGASRGNPGPSGTGYCIYGTDGQVIEKGGEFIGFATSRFAEYQAMKTGLERTLALGFTSARFVSDSLMVVNQLTGIFKVKNSDILPIYQSIQTLLRQFSSISFTHVPRSANQLADTEANLAIDRAIHR